MPGRPWRLHPSKSRFVASPRIGHTSRPNRAIDGRGLSPPRSTALLAATGLAPPTSCRCNRRSLKLAHFLLFEVWAEHGSSAQVFQTSVSLPVTGHLCRKLRHLPKDQSGDLAERQADLGHLPFRSGWHPVACLAGLAVRQRRTRGEETTAQSETRSAARWCRRLERIRSTQLQAHCSCR
jgi:hypothetical protein